MKTHSSLPVFVALTWLALIACSAPSGAATPTRTARTPTPSPIPIATAVIYVDSNRQPVWPTPPASCSTSAVASERPDLGPTLGEFPLWLASRALPVIPWRNELVRTVWVVDRSASGDLALSGHQVDGPGTVRFIREGGQRPSEQIVIQSAGSVGAQSTAPAATRYADVQIQLSFSQPGCYELRARLADLSRTFTVYAYN